MENHEARLNITYAGSNGDLPDPILYDANETDIKRWATEAVVAGSIPGIPAQHHVDFSDFVIERFAASDEQPNRIMLRPKVPFGN